jgi:hypothetical protein
MIFPGCGNLITPRGCAGGSPTEVASLREAAGLLFVVQLNIARVQCDR